MQCFVYRINCQMKNKCKWNESKNAELKLKWWKPILNSWEYLEISENIEQIHFGYNKTSILIKILHFWSISFAFVQAFCLRFKPIFISPTFLRPKWIALCRDGVKIESSEQLACGRQSSSISTVIFGRHCCRWLLPQANFILISQLAHRLWWCPILGAYAGFWIPWNLDLHF